MFNDDDNDNDINNSKYLCKDDIMLLVNKLNIIDNVTAAIGTADKVPTAIDNATTAIDSMKTATDNVTTDTVNVPTAIDNATTAIIDNVTTDTDNGNDEIIKLATDNVTTATDNVMTATGTDIDELFKLTLQSKVNADDIENIRFDISTILTNYYKTDTRDVSLKVFGSGVNGLGSSSSDIDFVLLASFLEDQDIRSLKEGYYNRLKNIEKDIRIINDKVDCCKSLIALMDNNNNEEDQNNFNDYLDRLKVCKKLLFRLKVNMINELKAVDPNNSQARNSIVNALYEISRLFKKDAQTTQVKEVISRARVGVLKFIYKNFKPCDLIINKEIGTRNSLMIKTYLELDKSDKIRCFILFIKNYAKAYDVCDSSIGFLSSYSWVMLCIHFLLRHDLIPNLQVSKGETFSDGYDTTFTILTDLPYSYTIRLQKLSITDMVRMFCDYYCTKVNFETDVITLRGKGELKSKTSFWSNINEDNMWRISIEDPFETVDSVHSHDLGKTVHSIKNQSCILDAIKNLSKLIENPDISVLKEKGADWYIPETTNRIVDNHNGGIFNRGPGGGRGRAQQNRGRGRGRGGGNHRFEREEMKDFVREELNIMGREVIIDKGRGGGHKNKGTTVCFRCKGLGHYARDCRNKLD